MTIQSTHVVGCPIRLLVLNKIFQACRASSTVALKAGLVETRGKPSSAIGHNARLFPARQTLTRL